MTLNLFIDQAIKMNPIGGRWGTTQLASQKQAKFFAWKLRQAIKAHDFEVDAHEDKLESFINAAFFLTEESAVTSTAFLIVKVTWGGANGNSLEVYPGKEAKKILGLKTRNGMELGRI